MYKEIGDTFKYQGVTLQVIETGAMYTNCKGCYFYETFGPCDQMLCCSTDRKDGKEVIFKKVQ